MDPRLAPEDDERGGPGVEGIGGTPGTPDPPSACSYCGGSSFEPPEDNGRVSRVECADCGGTMVSHGGTWMPDLIGSPHNHPSQAADPASGGVGGVWPHTPQVQLRTNDLSSRTAVRRERLVHAPINDVVNFAEHDGDVNGEDYANSLAEHVKEHGIEEPLTLHVHPSGSRATLHDGNHRLRAAWVNGHTHVPLIVKQGPMGSMPGSPYKGEFDHLPDHYGSRTAGQADYCRHRHAGHCWLPRTDENSGGVALYTPQDRGVCPWTTPTMQQINCPVSAPGPMSGMSMHASLDPEWRFHLLATWRDVRAKAKRIRTEGGVNILSVLAEGITGHVNGDTGVYESQINYVPGSKKIGYWQCGCAWASYAWGRAPAFRRFEGRMCSHALALQYEAQSRGMFGRPVEEDVSRPGWLRDKVRVRHDRDTRDHDVRAASRQDNLDPDGVYPSDHGLDLARSPLHAFAVEAYAVRRDPADVLRVFLSAGIEHADARRLLDATLHDRAQLEVTVTASEHEPDGPYFHGTRHVLKPGQMLTGGHAKANQGYGDPHTHVHYAEGRDVASLFAEAGSGPDHDIDARPRVYQVHPMHGHEPDPDEPDAGAWRATHVKVIREVPYDHKGVERLYSQGAKAPEPTEPTHAGVVLKAADTGRILMIQRSNDDESDPAAGCWEFPGGGREPGDHTSLHSGIREFEEEVGQPFPLGGHVQHVWQSPNGVYQGHVVVVPHEKDAVDFSAGRRTVNPDDPDGDDHEQSVWWDPDHARKNPALRPECKSSPWSMIKAATLQTTGFNEHDVQTTDHGFVDHDEEPDEFGFYEHSHTEKPYDHTRVLHSAQGTMHSPVLDIYRKSHGWLGEATIYRTPEGEDWVHDGHHKLAVAREGRGYVSAHIYTDPMAPGGRQHTTATRPSNDLLAKAALEDLATSPTITRGLRLSSAEDSTWHHDEVGRIEQGRARPEDLLRHLDRKNVGDFWHGHHDSLPDAKSYAEGDNSDHPGYYHGDEEMKYHGDDGSHGYLGQVGVALEAHRPPGWDPNTHPENGLMGNSYLPHATTLKLHKIHYNDSKGGWHSVDATGHTVDASGYNTEDERHEAARHTADYAAADGLEDIGSDWRPKPPPRRPDNDQGENPGSTGWATGGDPPEWENASQNPQTMSMTMWSNLHDEPEPALPSTTADEEDVVEGPGERYRAQMSPEISDADSSVNPNSVHASTGVAGIVERFQATAAAQALQTGGPDVMDIASAAREHLAKGGGTRHTALKNFSSAEQMELISEGRGQTARNLGDLRIEGTHYEALALAMAAEHSLTDPDDLFD